MSEREILFRGKRVDNNAWIEGPYIPGNASGYIYLAEQRPKMVLIYRETVGQYTGLKDKNGKRIFEWDIVDIIPRAAGIGIIKWDEDTARFIIEREDVAADFDNYWGHDLEVIGNIHDNPELMEAAP